MIITEVQGKKIQETKIDIITLFNKFEASQSKIDRDIEELQQIYEDLNSLRKGFRYEISQKNKRRRELEVKIMRLKRHFLYRSPRKIESYIPTDSEKQIIDSVCNEHKVTYKDLKSASRDKYLVLARNDAYKQLRKSNKTLKRIGNLFNRHHGSVISSLNTHL